MSEIEMLNPFVHLQYTKFKMRIVGIMVLAKCVPVVSSKKQQKVKMLKSPKHWMASPDSFEFAHSLLSPQNCSLVVRRSEDDIFKGKEK